jgi:hypothetical protein
MRDLTKTVIDQLKKCLGYLNEPFCRKDDSSTVGQARPATSAIAPTVVWRSCVMGVGFVLGAKERDGEPPTDYKLLRAIQVIHTVSTYSTQIQYCEYLQAAARHPGNPIRATAAQR